MKALGQNMEQETEALSTACACASIVIVPVVMCFFNNVLFFKRDCFTSLAKLKVAICNAISRMRRRQFENMTKLEIGGEMIKPRPSAAKHQARC